MQLREQKNTRKHLIYYFHLIISPTKVDPLHNFRAHVWEVKESTTTLTWGVGRSGATSIGDSAFAFLANVHRARAPSRWYFGLTKVLSISNSISIPVHNIPKHYLNPHQAFSYNQQTHHHIYLEVKEHSNQKILTTTINEYGALVIRWTQVRQSSGNPTLHNCVC